ncbi:MAG: nitrogen fixation protein NifX [Nitrospinae bacterium]|nr:nitrogen fixation protein NifX [Nitrospinota bacterium]
MKIAFATKDNITVNDHFGWCRTFAVYDVMPGGFNLLEMREIETDSSSEGSESDKIEKRINSIKDCTILYCEDIGSMAAARVIRNRIHPIKLSQPESIYVLLTKLIVVLKKPPIWLRKVLEREK